MGDVDATPRADLDLPLAERSGLHGRIFGRTGSGKSELAKRLMDELSAPVRAVYWTPDRGESVPGVPTRRSWDVELLEEPGAQVVLQAPSDRQEAQELLADVQRDLFAVGQHHTGDHPWVVFFHDEAQRETPRENPHQGAFNMVTQGRSLGVTYVAITQAPTQMWTRVRGQAIWTAIFALAPEERSWMRDAEVPEHIQDWIEYDGLDPTYRFGFEAGGSWFPYQPIDPV